MDLPERVVVIGDLNGQAKVLDELLLGTGLINSLGNWIGGSSVLVIMGDVINRGEGSRAAAERLIVLRPQARAQGGEVLWILGNHEVMTAFGHEGYVTPEEYMEFAEPQEIEAFRRARSQYQYQLLGSPRVPHRIEPIGGRIRAWEEDYAPGKDAFRAAMSRDGWLGRYIRSLPVAVILGPLCFVHGGLSAKWARLGVEALADVTRRAWLEDQTYYQLLDPRGIFRDPHGPLWHRKYCISDSQVILDEAHEVAKTLGVERLIVGHTRTDSAPGGMLGVPLLRQQGRVLMVDVGIGAPGQPGCALVVEDGCVDTWSPLQGRTSICAIKRVLTDMA